MVSLSPLHPRCAYDASFVTALVVLVTLIIDLLTSIKVHGLPVICASIVLILIFLGFFILGLGQGM